MEELKACPFCGGEASISPYDGGKTVICMDCLCQAPTYRGDDALEKSIAAWNRRAVPESDYAALKAKYDEINRYNISCTKKIDELLAEKLPPENKPLTLDELRGMDGEPVWIVILDGSEPTRCEIVVECFKSGIKMANTEDLDDYGAFDLYGKTWLAYARRPEDAP